MWDQIIDDAIGSGEAENFKEKSKEIGRSPDGLTD